MTTLTPWIANLFEHPDMVRMGHAQRLDDLNLGLGWVYYAMARAMRPQTAVVIGSYRGFVPLVLAKGLSDNAEGGRVTFIDPSLVDDFWREPQAVNEHFERYGATNIEHHLMTTQQFVESEAYRSMGPAGIVFVDGYHSEEQARFDFEAFKGKLTPDGVMLFHDSASQRMSRMYGPDKPYQHRVKFFLDTLKKDSSWQVFDLPLADGVTLVRRVTEG